MRTSSESAPRGRRLPETLTGEEQRQLLMQPNPAAPTGLRNLCMMQLMLDAGLRTSEVLKLRVRDIDWMSGKLTVVRGKGDKDRVLWLNEDALDRLREWRERRPEQPPKASAEPGFLFTTLRGDPVRDNYYRKTVKRYAVKAGIFKDVHPHTLRHTFATDLYRETKNIRMVQKALGHADISTTMLYTHIVDEDLEDAMRTFRRN
jgi:integrase/recombinase XerD